MPTARIERLLARCQTEKLSLCTRFVLRLLLYHYPRDTNVLSPLLMRQLICVTIQKCSEIQQMLCQHHRGPSMGNRLPSTFYSRSRSLSKESLPGAVSNAGRGTLICCWGRARSASVRWARSLPKLCFAPIPRHVLVVYVVTAN